MVSVTVRWPVIGSMHPLSALRPYYKIVSNLVTVGTVLSSLLINCRMMSVAPDILWKLH